jgi:hypothetical protein
MLERKYVKAKATAFHANTGINQVQKEDESAHKWYRFVLSFPPHLVREYVVRFGLTRGQVVLDPFCGTGTTLVECKKLGLESIGLEAHPMCHFASRTKVNWSEKGSALKKHATKIAEIANENLSRDLGGLRALPEKEMKLLIKGSISPIPLHKTLVLQECLRNYRSRQFSDYENLALASKLVTSIGNLRFGPEVGITKPKEDVPVVEEWLNAVYEMADDLEGLMELDRTPASVHLSDSREVRSVLKPSSIDAVITSPPYPNEKDYTRTTRLESVLLGFIDSRGGLQEYKRTLLRSNSRNVYKGDDDCQWVAHHKRIQELANSIESRRIELGKTSGFEKLYHRVVTLYFGGMARHLAELRTALRPGAQLAYVVGDQASFLRVMIRTGELLADIAEELGYEVIGLDLFRTRFSTVTKENMREEVLLLRWPGK